MDSVFQASQRHGRTALQMAAGRPAKPGLVCALACSSEQTLKLGCCCAIQNANSACARAAPSASPLLVRLSEYLRRSGMPSQRAMCALQGAMQACRRRDAGRVTGVPEGSAAPGWCPSTARRWGSRSQMSRC